MTRITIEQYNSLVDSIYESGFDHSHWPKFLNELSSVLDDSCIGMQGHDLKYNKNLIGLATNMDADYMDSYRYYYASKNPWMAAFSTCSIGIPFHSDAIIAKEDLKKTEFYNDWLLPQEDISNGTGLVLFRENNRALIIASNNRAGSRRADESDISTVLRLLAPHIQRSFGIQRSLEGNVFKEGNFEELLNVNRNALFLLDQKRRIIVCNTNADTYLKNRKYFYLDRWRILRAIDRRADRAIDAAIHAVTVKSSDETQHTIYLRGKNAQEPHFATVVPFRPNIELTATIFDFCSQRDPVVMLTVVDPRRNTDPIRQSLSVIYQLSPTEIALAQAIYHGHTLQSYADAREVSIHTVRNQLKSVFGKLDVRKQSQLVAIVGRLSQ